MNKRYVKRLDKEVSEIGFGAWQLGSTGGTWDKMEETDAITLVRQAVEQGVSVFDTAPGYGGGNSELILGKALKGLRHKVHINTKIGHGPNGEYEFSKEGISISLHRSLEKLQTTYLDSVILHNPEHYILEGKTDLFEELETYKEQGIIKGYGVSIDSVEELKTVLDNLDIDVIEIMFNMIHQEPRYLFDQVKEKGIMLIIKVPFDSGWLTGRFTKDTNFSGIRSRWTQDVKEIRDNIVSEIKETISSKNLIKEALAYILHYDAVSTIIPGTRTIKHLESNVEASSFRLVEKDIQALEELYETKIKSLNTPW